MEPITLEKSVDIILTPQFYTFIRESLEVRFSYQAKQIAASLFDDYLNNSAEYQYHVYKCNDEWCFFAYNIDEIDNFLETIGIDKHRVAKIYFAQQLQEELVAPVELSQKNVLQTIDETVTLIPKRLMEAETSYKTLYLDNIKLSAGVTMGASLNSFISLKDTIILSSLFCILGAVFIVEGGRIKSSIAGEDAKLTQLLDDNPKYTSSLLRNSILEKYRPIDQIERAKRQNIKEISKLLSAKSQLKELSISKTTIKATIATSTKHITKQVIDHAKAKKFKSSSVELTVKVEKTL